MNQLEKPIKTRVLWVGEATYLSTGYSVYGKEVLSRLYKNPKIELAELACWANPTDPRLQSIPWKVYPNGPHPNDEQGKRDHENNHQFPLGEAIFDKVVLDFKPHVVIDIRDVFMFDFIDRSPARKYFRWLQMPTVDSTPQNEQWLDIIMRADGVFTYQEWSYDVLRRESGGKIKLLGHADPSAAKEFVPRDKLDCKSKFGLQDFTILGTVMRNQPRKLFPELFKAFAQYLQQSKREDVLLYCHTSYPDMGWDFARLLNDYGIASKVLFTYICKNCGTVFPMKFSDGVSPCTKCGRVAASPSNVQIGVDNNTLSIIYNCFDLYIQYANSEGYGMSIAEAAACGVPIVATDFSAMEATVPQFAGKSIPLHDTYIEHATGCQRAIPDHAKFIEMLHEILNYTPEQMAKWSKKTREGFCQYSSWDVTAHKWENAILSIDPRPIENHYQCPKDIRRPPEPRYDLSNSDFAKWLILEVLGQPERLFSLMHLRLEKDLNLGYTGNITGGMYYNELSEQFAKRRQIPFNKELAYEHFLQLRGRINEFENKRQIAKS